MHGATAWAHRVTALPRRHAPHLGAPVDDAIVSIAIVSIAIVSIAIVSIAIAVPAEDAAEHVPAEAEELKGPPLVALLLLRELE